MFGGKFKKVKISEAENRWKNSEFWLKYKKILKLKPIIMCDREESDTCVQFYIL